MLLAGEDPLYIARRMIRFASEDIGNADPQALQISQRMAGMNLVQNGPGNSVEGRASDLGAGLVIQNTLNDQQIRVQTVIHASSNGLGMLRNSNTLGTVQDAVARAIGSR